MKRSLRTRLSLTYAAVTLICVLLISLLTNLLLDRHFKEYIKQNQKRSSNELVALISQQYVPDGEVGQAGRWNIDSLEDICINALEQGMIIKVTDDSGNTIWDATLHDNALCRQMIDHMDANMKSRYLNWEGGYTADTYPLIYRLSTVGKVEIGYYGPYFFNDNDLEFINTLNGLLVITALLSLLLSLAIGSVMAKRISVPITRVTAAARMISKGHYDGRVEEKSNTNEISQLTDTINELARTLESQEVLRKRLTADMAHELRTPLATLQSHMEAMIDGIWEPDRDRLGSCHDEILRIGRMVDDLEKLARYESEDLVLNTSAFDISGLIQHIVKNFEADFMAKGVGLTFSGEEETIVADRDKISQVMINLLSNALKYTPQGGSTEVSVKDAGSRMEIRVRDTGYGISTEDLPHIFERLYRADRSRNRQTGGAGIGLAIAKALIDAHNGSIRVQSRVNEGTEFVIMLPKHPSSELP